MIIILPIIFVKYIAYLICMRHHFYAFLRQNKELIFGVIGILKSSIGLFQNRGTSGYLNGAV